MTKSWLCQPLSGKPVLGCCKLMELLGPHPTKRECLTLHLLALVEPSFVFQTESQNVPVALVKTVMFLSWMGLMT